MKFLRLLVTPILPLCVVFTLLSCGGGSDSNTDSQVDSGSSADDSDDSSTDTLYSLPALITASIMLDIDADGDLDIIIGSQDDERSAADVVLRNDGDDTFVALPDVLPERYLGINGATVAYALIDGNNDGIEDILAITVDAGEDFYGTSKLQLWLVNGDGTFTDASAQISDNIKQEWPEWTRVGDFDNDGYTDFMLTKSSLCVYSDIEFCYGGQFYLNNGEGKFAPVTVTLTDHLGSKTVDALEVNSYGDYASIEEISFTSEVASALSGDLNNDGLLDIFAPNCRGGDAWAQGFPMASFINTSEPGNLSFTLVYSGNANDGEYVPGFEVYLDNPSVCQGALVDLNGDGNLDVVLSDGIAEADGETTPLYAMLNDGNGLFTYDTESRVPADVGLEHGRQWLSGDFNADGYSDILIADHGYDYDPFPGQANLLLLSDGAGTLVDASSANLSSASSYTHGASLGDLDGDGTVDLFLNNLEKDENWTLTLENDARFWLNSGSGAFSDYSPVVIE